MNAKTWTSVASLTCVGRSSHGLLAAVVLANSMFCGSVANAEPTKNAVVAAPILHPGVSKSARQLLDRGFLRALRRAELNANSVAAECHGETCWKQQAEAQQAELVVSYCADTIDGPGLCDPRKHGTPAVDGKHQDQLELPHSFQFAATVYSPVTGLASSASAGCSSCSAAEAADRLQGLTETLLGRFKTPDGVGQIRLNGLPAGTLIFADGVLRQTAGTGPVILALQADEPHVFDIYPPGYVAVHNRNVRVTAGEVSSVDVPLREQSANEPSTDRGEEDSPESPSAPSSGYVYPTKPPTWRWALPLVLIGAGGLMLGLGARAYSIKGTCSDQMGCPMTYNTEQVGMGLLGVGGALVGIGGITLAFGVQKVYVRVPPSSSD